jgi:hypothetical protein
LARIVVGLVVNGVVGVDWPAATSWVLPTTL